MHYVPILDAGISLRSGVGYTAYDEAKKADLFMKIKTGEDLVGQVWPKDAVYPDWFNPKTAPWWQDQLTSMFKNLPFDGLWLDMNEASDFCGGICNQDQQVDSPVKYKLPYTPTAEILKTTLCLLIPSVLQTELCSLILTTFQELKRLWRLMPGLRCKTREHSF